MNVAIVFLGLITRYYERDDRFQDWSDQWGERGTVHDIINYDTDY